MVLSGRRLILITLLSLVSSLGLISPVFALTSSDIVSAGSVWLETTIAVALVFLMVMALSLQIARGYFLRILNKFTLRLGADIWWLTYVLIRDGLIFSSFVAGLMYFFPGTFQDFDMAVPFMPVAVVLFAGALLTKLYFDADENRNAYRVVTVLLFLGTILYLFGAVFILETPTVLSTLPSGVSSTSGFWYWVYNTFSSKVNVDLSLISFEVCLGILGVIGLAAIAHPFLHSRLPKKRGVAASAPPPKQESLNMQSPEK
jgi:hypothetical protein